MGQTTPDLTRPSGRARAWFDLIAKDHGFLRPLFNRPTPVAVPGRPVSGRLWRSAQPGPKGLAALQRQGIRTIVNLRGARRCGSYVLERAAAERLGLTLIDFPVNSRQLPERERIERLAELFQSLETPALIHCKSGADRAGLVATLWLILQEDVPVAEALNAQLGNNFLHLAGSRTGILDHFFKAYLAETAERPMPFMQWVREVYDPERIAPGFTPDRWSSAVVDMVLKRE